MMAHLNIVEQECQLILKAMMNEMAPQYPRKKRTKGFWLVMSHRVRDCLRHLENKEFGCPTGQHPTDCVGIDHGKL